MNSPFTHPANSSLTELVERIKGFDHHAAVPSEQADFIEALQLVADEIVTRWGIVHALETELRGKITSATLRERLAKVLDVTAKGKPGVIHLNELPHEPIRDAGFFSRMKAR